MAKIRKEARPTRRIRLYRTNPDLDGKTRTRTAVIAEAGAFVGHGAGAAMGGGVYVSFAFVDDLTQTRYVFEVDAELFTQVSRGVLTSCASVGAMQKADEARAAKGGAR
jgi:hypothetical protein